MSFIDKYHIIQLVTYSYCGVAVTPTGPITLAFPQTVSVTEGSAPLTGFGIEGQAIEDIPFSLRPLTYQQFETQSGLIVTDIFSDVPAAASTSMSDVHVCHYYFEVYYSTSCK